MSTRPFLLIGAVSVLAFGLTPAVRAEPTLRTAGGWWILSELPPILDEKEVKPPLTSGLTTSFHLSVQAQDGLAGAARVEIRYLLWEEAFDTRVISPDGRVADLQIQTLDDLRRWWLDLEVAILPTQARRSGGESVRITLDVLPFLGPRAGGHPAVAV